MSIKEKLLVDIKQAMRDKDKEKLSVLRMVLSEIKYTQANKSMSEELPKAEELKVVMTYSKRLTKSLADFPEGELKEKTKKEIEIVKNYLPKMASKIEIETIISALQAENSDYNFGQMMKEVRAKLSEPIDGKMISDLIKAAMT